VLVKRFETWIVALSLFVLVEKIIPSYGGLCVAKAAELLRQAGGHFLYSLDRLPNHPKLRQRLAEFLRKQGKEDLARELEVWGNKQRKMIPNATRKKISIA
jgi:hypothetical protein